MGLRCGRAAAPRWAARLAALALLAGGPRIAEAFPVEELPAADKGEGFCPGELRRVESLASTEDASMFDRYLQVCNSMQVKPSADALVSLQLGSERLTPRPSGSLPFGDLELRALVMLLEDGQGAKLRGLRHLDLSGCSLGPAGLLLVSHLLQHPSCGLELLDLSNQLVDRESVCRVASAVGRSRSLRLVRMRHCFLGDEGGKIIVDLLENTSAHMLKELDIQNNFISFDMCNNITQAAKARGVRVRLSGNRVLDEVFNSVSHGFGEILAIIGTVFLLRKTGSERPSYQVWSVVMYCSALNLMYLSSTLYHAFFALGRTTVYVFSILDYSGIFLLIAGSYSPFLGIALYEECWACVLLTLMWTGAIMGICTAAFCTGPYAVAIRLTLYITMGWVILICIRPLARKLGGVGTFLLFIGGVLYTGGVPFFVRARHTLGLPDHTIWHLFVIAGTVMHFFCIYKYVLCEKARAMPRGDSDKSARPPSLTAADEYMSVPLQPL